MEDTQLFRLIGTTYTKTIPCKRVDGQSVVLWDDIEQVFSNVQHVENRGVAVNLLRDSNRQRIVPRCIKHSPDVVLDVVLSNAAKRVVGPPTPRSVNKNHPRNRMPGPIGAGAIASSLPSRVDARGAQPTSPLLPTPPLVSSYPLPLPPFISSYSPPSLLESRYPLPPPLVSGYSLPPPPLAPASPLLRSPTRDTNGKNLPSSSTSPTIAAERSFRLSPEQRVILTQRKARESEVEERLASLLSPSSSGRVSISKAIQEIRSKQVTQQGRAKPLTQDDSAKQLSQIWDLFFACHHELKDEMDNNTDLMVRLVIMQNEAKALQAQAHSQLTPLEKRIRAILNRPCELNESLVPRLFVVFPQDCSTWDYENPSHNKLRLYFLCDCGDHSRSIDNKIPHDVHFAKHDGYDLVRPTEFFQLYGIYVLTIMQMLRSRIPVAGITIPTLPHLIGMDTIDQDAESVNELVTGVEQCMDQVIDYITMVSGRAANVDPKKGRVDIIDESIAVDLAQLKTFLKPKKEKTIGNLHRTVTPDGQVRWVCGSHYHDIHQENDGQVLQSALAVVKGSFDETVGRVQVAVSSSKELELLCSALRKSQGVYGLKIEFLWDASYDDLKKLRDALFRKNIGALEFCFRDNSEIQLDISSLSVRCDSTQNRGLRYEPILEIMQQPSVYSFALSLAPWDIFHRSSLLCRNDYFFNLRFLEIGLKSMAAGIQDLKGLVAKSPNLVNLTMNVKTTELVDVYDAIAEHQTCPVLFKEQALRILPPARHQSLSNVKSRDLTDFLRVHGGQIESLSLNKDWNAKLDVMVFAETIQKESKLKEFGLKEVDLRLGERCIKYLGNIIALSELRKLEISLGDEDERALVLELIGWTHLRELTIGVKQARQVLVAMKPVAEVIWRTRAGRVELERFKLCCEGRGGTMSREEQEALRGFLETTTLEQVEVDAPMDVGQAVELLKAVNVYRLQRVELRAAGFGWSDVQQVLNALAHAGDLETVVMRQTAVEDSQRRMASAWRVVFAD